MRDKIKYLKGVLGDQDVLLVLIIVLSCFGSFAMGRLSVSSENNSATVVTHSIFENLDQKSSTFGTQKSRALPDLAATVEGAYVASKNGTKYHLPWCPGASQISEQNKVWFESKEVAEKAGYTPAANCKGI